MIVTIHPKKWSGIFTRALFALALVVLFAAPTPAAPLRHGHALHHARHYRHHRRHSRHHRRYYWGHHWYGTPHPPPPYKPPHPHPPHRRFRYSTPHPPPPHIMMVKPITEPDMETMPPPPPAPKTPQPHPPH